MNGTADIVSVTDTKDSEGFSVRTDTVLATVCVYREGRHGTEKWTNLAAFSDATDLFRFRTVPDLLVTTSHFIVQGTERFNILSVENVRGRGMYTEVLAKKEVPSVG